MLVDRRSFLQSSLALGVATGVGAAHEAFFPLQLAAAATSHRASVLEFGADPTGEKDATAAVRKAIASLASNDARLVFPAGKYRFAASNETAMQFTGFDGVQIFANNAELLFAGNTVPFEFRSSKDVAVHDMKLDWPRPSFSQGVVRETGPQWFAIDIDPAFQVTGSEAVTGFAEFDPQTRRPAFDGMNVRISGASITLVKPQRLRIAWQASERLGTPRAGMPLILLHATSSDTGCFVFDGCQGILLDEVTVRHAPAAAFLVRGCRDLHMEDVSVAPDTAGIALGAQRLLAAGGDGLRCGDCHGNIVLKAVHFEGITGDAISIYQSYWKIIERPDDRTVVITGGGPGTLETGALPQAGDFVQFSSPTTLQLLGEIGISTVEPTTANRPGTTLTFPETLSPVIVPGTLVCGVVDAPRISLDHATIANTLGRGLVLHTRGEITNNLFEGCAQEAILLAPDRGSLQGPAVQNVRIRSNTFEGCNLASQGRGIISIDTSQERAVVDTSSAASPNALNSGVHIQGNTFIRSTSAAIYASSVDDLVIQENTLGHAPTAQPGQTPVAIVLRNVAHAELSNNISNVPQTIAMTHCADTVATENNRLLTTAKLG